MRIPVVVIGAGHSGLAASRALSDRSIDHVVLERGEVAHTWRTERWDSLRLLTPSWLTRLPGLAYDGDDPDGFMPVPELVAFLERYASVADVPVREHTEVTSVTAHGDGYRVVTTDGTWEARAVVIASGPFNRPVVPAVAEALPSSIAQVTPHDYKRPDQLGDGRVLVVGASATGIQIADELLRSGREVTVAVGEHVRMPRTYRGRDVMAWMVDTGRMDERWDEVDDLVRARHVPSPQLVGTPERSDLDLNTLTARGAELVGRLSGASGTTASFSGSLANVCKLADLKQARLLSAFDEWAAANGWDAEPGSRPKPIRVDPSPRVQIDLVAEGFDTVLFATGFAAEHPWLDVPVFDRKGRIRHDGGVVVDAPGLYRMGLTFLRRRSSSFIHGAEADANDLVAHLADHLAATARPS